MKVPYEQAVLKVHCGKHDREIEFFSDDDATGILDRLQLVCPGLTPVILDIHERQTAVTMAARTACGLFYKTDHPDEFKDLPSGYIPLDRWSFDDFPDRFRERLLELDRLEETEADECLASWTVELTTVETTETT